MDPRELPIQQQPPLLIDGQTPCVLSNQQPNYSGGNDEYLTMFRELIADELQDASGAGEIAQPHGAEGLDPTEVMSEELLEAAVGWETPGQDVSSGIQFDSMFQPTSSSLAQPETEFSYSDDQDLPFDNLIQVDDGQRSHGSQNIRMDEDANTDIAEPEDIGMHNYSDRKQNENSHFNAGHHQAVTRKSSLEASGRPKGTNAAKPTRLSRIEKGNRLQFRDLASIRCEPPRSGLAPSTLKSRISQRQALKVRHLATGLYWRNKRLF